MGKLGDKRALKHLIQAIKDDKNMDVRLCSVNALGAINDQRAVEPLIEMLQDESRDLRKYSVEALGQIGDKTAAEPLIKMLKNNDNILRLHSANALGAIGDERAVEPLIELLKDNANPRAQLFCFTTDTATLLHRGAKYTDGATCIGLATSA